MKKPRKKISNPRTVAPPLKPYYSNAVRVSSGPLLFIAGQIAVDKAGKVVGKGDLRAQAVKVLENIRGHSGRQQSRHEGHRAGHGLRHRHAGVS